MIEDGIITRADIMDASIANNLKIKIGMSLNEVKKQYPNVVVEPHQYDPTGHYLIFKSEDNKNAILFEEVDGKISEVRAGIVPSVQYVEGCL